MNSIIRGRETGKARDLIAFAAKNNAIIVTENPNAFKVKAESYGFPNVEIIAWEDFILSVNFKKKFVIHNIDKMMNWFCGGNLLGFSATLNEEKTNA